MIEQNIHTLIIPSWYPSLNYPLNGVFFKEQAEALKKAGIKVGIVYSEISGLRQFKLSKLKYYNLKTKFQYENEIPVYRFCSWNFYPSNTKKQFDYWVKHCFRLAELYIEKFGKPDIIHAHSAVPGGYVAYLLYKKYNIPYIVTEHSSNYAMNLIQEWEKDYIKTVFKNAKEAIAVSLSFSNLLKTYSEGREFKVIPNPVDTEFFSFKKNKKLEPFTFLTVAFLNKIKGIDIFLKAFSKAFKGKEEVRIKIGGDGSERLNLEKLSKELGIESQVDFLGGLNRQQVKEEMQNANIFVLPSRFETFGVVVIEALATGTPAISTKCGGPTDIIIEEVGELVEVDDVEALKEALLKTYANYDKYEREKIREYVLNKFSNEAIISEVVELYRKFSTIVH